MTTTLNTHAAEIQLWENTRWLLDYAEDNNGTNGGKWSDWDDGEHIRTTYEDDRGPDGGPGGNVEVGPRGLEILDAAVRGEDYEDLLEEWNIDIFYSSQA